MTVCGVDSIESAASATDKRSQNYHNSPIIHLLLGGR